MDKNQGYAILKAVMLENGRGFALGEHPTAPSRYVTWACYDDEKGQRQYEWGHYGNDLPTLENDLASRVQEYLRQFKVEIVQTEAPGLYQYYSTQRPVDIGTFPKPPHNAPDEIANYDQRIPVEGGAFRAWGHLTYTKPLTAKQASDYELRPAKDNPDIRREAAVKRPITEQMKTAAKLAAENRGQSRPEKGRARQGRQIRSANMDEKYNPMKSAETAAEQNYNMIDGVLNNLPAAPEQEKEKDKVKEPPNRRRSREREER